MYDRAFSTEPCVTLAFSQIQYPDKYFGYGLRVKQKEKYQYIGKCSNIIIIRKNRIPGNNDLLKVTSTKIKYGYQIERKNSISKINEACSNTNLLL